MIASTELEDVLAGHPLFSGLAAASLAALAGQAVQRIATPQATIFAEGERCDGLWLVVSGWVRLFHTSPDGRRHIVAFRGSGCALELGPALDGRRFTVSAMSPGGATLLLLPRAGLQVISRAPTFVRAVIDQLCLEVRELDTATTVAVSRDAKGRTYCTLLRLAQQFGESNGPAVRIQHRLTRQDIADASGVTLETAIRVLCHLQRNGLVETQSQLVEISDIGRLQRASGCLDCQLSCASAGLGDGGLDQASVTPMANDRSPEWRHRREPAPMRPWQSPSRGGSPARAR